MKGISLAGLLAVMLVSAPARAEVPDAIAVPSETLVARFHAEGAQIYDCKADASGQLAWQFREPIATLIENGKTVGRHYAGPHWELDDGSVVLSRSSGLILPGSCHGVELL